MTQEQAITILKTGENVFLTGEPGAGKTYTVNRYVSYLRDYSIEPSITASTGIAATHIHGMTIHSWSGIGIKKDLNDYELDRIAKNEHIERRIKKSKVLIIDEISMLDARTLDNVDAICRRVKDKSHLPFGGIQIVLVGDFFQLPPVSRQEKKARFAFESNVWKEMDIKVCYLSEQHRQEDQTFLSILSSIRRDNIEEKHYEGIGSRMPEHHDLPKNITKLFCHNVDVDRINNEELEKISEKPTSYDMTSTGPSALVESLKRGCLSPEKLILKKGTVVMFTKNNMKDGFVNGTLGKVVSFDEETGYPVIKTKNGQSITAYPMEWTVEENGRVRATIVQIPLKLAWAITIHKSQGMSLDAALMDLSQVFEYGQGYVALSRVRNLSGLYLLGINDHALLVHPDVLTYDQTFRDDSVNSLRWVETVPGADIQKIFSRFIEKCGGKKLTEEEKEERKKTKKSPQKSTYEETLEIFTNGKNIDEIAKIRGLVVGTILSHFEVLISEKKISREEFKKLLAPSLIKELPLIISTFKKLDTNKLSPVRESLGGKYSYDQLRIARMMME